MSTTVTVRPTSATVVAGSWVIQGGAASIEAALADGNNSGDNSGDTTFIADAFGVAGNDVRVGFSAPTIPAGAKILSVTPRARAVCGSAGVGGASFVLITPGGIQGPGYNIGPGTPTGTFSGVALANVPGGTGWTVAEVDSIEVRLVGWDAAAATNFIGVYLDVTYNEAPTATGTGPNAIVETSRPTVTWSYADPDGDLQERYRIKVFDAAQYGAGGFDPNTSSPAVDSGEVLSGATSWTLPVDLVNGTAYRAYIFVADVGSGGRYNLVTAAGPYATMTINITPPAAPGLTAVADSAAGRVALNVADRQNMLSADDASFEISLGGWTATANCALARVAYAMAGGDGSYVAQLTATAGGDMSATSPQVAAAAGHDYSGLGRFAPATTGRDVRVDLAFYDSGHALLSTATGTPVSVAAGAAANAYCSATAPASTAYVALVANVLAAAGSEQWNVDTTAVVPFASTSFAWTRGGLLALARLAVERSTDAGATWSDLTRLYVAGTGVSDLSGYDYDDVTQTFTVYDYEAPVGGALSYRARVSAVVGPDSIVSAWSSASAAGTLTASGLWIKDPLNPALSIAVNADQHSLVVSRDESEAAHYGLGRADPVVVHGSVRLGTFGLVLFFLNDASYYAWKLLQDSQRTLLLQTCYGDSVPEQFYFTLDPTVAVERITVAGMRNAQPRRVTLTGREVVMA